LISSTILLLEVACDTSTLNSASCKSLRKQNYLFVKWIPGSENKVNIFTNNLDGPLFKHYAELFLGKGALSGKGGDTK
jgi:hypothetical protein